EREVDRQDPFRRDAAEDRLEQGQSERVRVLFHRQPQRRSSALEPGVRTPHRRGRAVRAEAQDASVQRLRRAGGVVIRRHGPRQKLLMVPARVLQALEAALFVACLVPLALLVNRALHDALGANPIESINRYLGDWALRFLLITLAVTP